MKSIRTWIVPSVLSLVAGYVDTIGFVSLFGLFTAHVTGNFVLVGATLGSIAGGGLSSGLIGKLLALPVFIIGVALTTIILRSKKNASGNAARLALLLQAGGISCFMLAGQTSLPFLDADANSVLICSMLGVLAMSIQNAGARLVFTEMAPSTVMTGNVTQLVVDGIDLLKSIDAAMVDSARARVYKTLPSVIAFSVGALSGGLAYHFISFAALAPAVAALLFAATVPIKQ
jgi:uncharacterized membrane protein YoaK (UPF0700 family)